MIVVLGRPRVYRPEPDGELAPGGLGVEVALALGRAGVGVELVGSIGDDPEGDRVVVALGQAGVGHAALLRDPSMRTPPLGEADAARGLPRLEAADVELGLRYVSDCRVLVIAEDLDPAARQAALAAGDFHAAAIILIASAGSVDPDALGEAVTLLERPGAGHGGPGRGRGGRAGGRSDRGFTGGRVRRTGRRLRPASRSGRGAGRGVQGGAGRRRLGAVP